MYRELAGSPIWSEAQIAQFHRLYALRSELAGFAARQAAVRVARGVSSEPLEICLRAMQETARQGNYEAFLNADMAFHRVIAQLASTPTLLDMWDLLEHSMRDFAAWAQRTLFHDLEMIAQAHQTQYDTIRDGQPKAAERAAHVDLDALWQMLSEQPAVSTGDADPVERVCAHVMLNLHRRLSLAYVAREIAHLSPSHLAKLFRDTRQEPFSVYVQGLRLRRAASLLEETDLSVQDIADRVGYADVSRFGSHFRRQFGSSPTEWRHGEMPREMQQNEAQTSSSPR